MSFDDVEAFNQRLATTIQEEYYRVYPYVCAALKLYIQDIGEDIPANKDVYVSFADVNSKARYVVHWSFRAFCFTKIYFLITLLIKLQSSKKVDNKLFLRVY